MTPADEQDRAQVARLCEAVQAATGDSVELAFVDQGYTGADPAEAASGHGMRLEVVKHAEAKRRFRRLAKDYERLPETGAGLRLLAFVCLMLLKVAVLMAASP